MSLRLARLLPLGLLAAAAAADAGPITFNTALPVATDVFTARIQAIQRERGDDLAAGRMVDVDGVIAALGYGLTRDWTGIAVARYLDKELDAPGPSGRVRRRAQGIGDTTLLARYTAFERNAPGRLLRIAPIGGVSVPTGVSDERDALGEVPAPLQPGTGAWAAIAGVILTRQTLAREFDLTVQWTAHGRDEGFERGDELELAGSWQQRLPWPARGADAFAYAVLEIRAIHRGDDTVAGEPVDSGGSEWRITPGLQYVSRRWVAEAAIELPLADDLPDGALRDESFVHVGVRFNF